MPKLSIIIPSRNEQFLPNTVNDLLKKCGDIEVIAVLDGYWPDPPLVDDNRLVVLHRGKAMGMRAAINAGVGIARGEWIAKIDAHCMVDEGFDEKLIQNCDKNWLMIPRRYSLDAEKWERKPKSPVDYHYLSCPWTNKDGFSFHGQQWNERKHERAEYEIDDELSWQGSFWFMNKYVWNTYIKQMDEANYGTFSQEPQEIGMKVWLGGGRIVTNKKTWYAHLHKGKKYGRGYFLDKREVDVAHQFSARYWVNNLWEDRVHDFEWLIDKFWPVPTWPENWKELPIPDGYVQAAPR